MTNSRDEAYYALPPSMLDASSSSCEKMMAKKEGMIGDRDSATGTLPWTLKEPFSSKYPFKNASISFQVAD